MKGKNSVLRLDFIVLLKTADGISYARGKFDVYRPEVPYLGSYFSSHFGSFTLQGLNLFLSMGTPSGFDDGSMRFSATVNPSRNFPVQSVGLN
jgi:hypothetical protein